MMQEEMEQGTDIDRRGLLQGLGLAATGATLGAAGATQAASIQPADAMVRLGGRAIRIVDLTHKLTKAFNFGQPPRIAFEPIDGSGKAVGMKLNRLSLVEHTGTHIDAPSHFGEGGRSLGEIPVSDLVVPLAVLDFRERRAADPNAQVGVADIEAWESRHGRLPAGCCVALWSGFDVEDIWRSLEKRQIPKTPGFGAGVVELLAKRSVKGVAVDAMNLDSGNNAPAYPFHQKWLATGGWGIEGMANLGTVPAKGAVLVVGAPPVEGATGMPIRVIALI